MQVTVSLSWMWSWLLAQFYRYRALCLIFWNVGMCGEVNGRSDGGSMRVGSGLGAGISSVRVMVSACVVKSGRVGMDDFGCVLGSWPKKADAFFPWLLLTGCGAACGVCLARAASVTGPAATSCLAKRTSSALDVRQAYNKTRLTASGGGMSRPACTSPALGVGQVGRGQSVRDEVNMPYLSVGGLSLHDVCATSSEPRCDSCSACFVYASLDAEMASGCDVAWRRGSCLDGGGSGGDGGASAKPCLSWVPFVRFDSGRPLVPRGCDGVSALCSSFFRASGPSRASSMNECRFRACVVWSCPSQRVAPVTQPWAQQSALGGGPGLCL